MSHDLQHINDDLLVKYLLDECRMQEIAMVEEWLETSDENKNYYNQIKEIWEQSKTISIPNEPDENEAWDRLKAKMLVSKSRFTFTRTVYYAAASLLLLFSLFGLYNYVNKKDTNTVSPYVMVDTLIEAKKMTMMDTLSDKSVVTLNKNSTLKYPVAFTAKERRVKLKGEAFFNITPNKEKPFFIEASNDVEIRVIGTSFNVKAFDDYTEVVVETGIVEVRKFNKVILLHPNERARIDKEDSTIVIQKSKDKLYKYYRSKEFECDNTPLWKVVEVLNEAYGDSIVIGRNELKSLSLTTRFDNESLEDILDIISETFELKVEKQGNKYILK